MTGALWILLPLMIAGGSALLSFVIMEARMEVAVARERELLAEANAAIKASRDVVEERVLRAEDACYRKALDQFMSDFRVEERHYVRESKNKLGSRKSMVVQERLFFRNIPLSNWVEQEMTLEEGGDLAQLAKACSAFSTRSIDTETASVSRLIS